jgi:hypothetical protein
METLMADAVDINFTPQEAIAAGEEVIPNDHVRYLLPTDEAYRFVGEVKVAIDDDAALKATLDHAVQAGFWFFITKKPSATKNYSVYIYGTREHTDESVKPFIDLFNELEGKKEL